MTRNPLIYRSISSSSNENVVLNFALFISVLAFVYLFVPNDLLAANPLETLSGIFKKEASDHAFPVIIIWILAGGIIASALMTRWMPFIFAVIACVFIGISPEVAGAFNSTNITPASGSW